MMFAPHQCLIFLNQEFFVEIICLKMCNNAIILYMPEYSSEIFLLPISFIRRTFT